MTLTAGCKAPTEPVSVAGAGLWGDAKGATAPFMLTPSVVPKGVLEVFLMGGLNPWDTFYVVPEHGDPARGGPYAGQQWWTFQTGDDSVASWFQRCDGGSRSLYSPFATDANGKTVNLGPWLYPLRERPDILSRMRLVVVRHDLEPHEAAVPLCITGHSRGAPGLSSTGAHVQRYHAERGSSLRITPYSYVLFPNSDTVGNFNVEAASATGIHPGMARPLSVPLRADTQLPEQLERSIFGGRHAAVDALVSHYTAQFRTQFNHPEFGPGRVPRLERFDQARKAVQQAPELANILTADALQSFGGEECGLSVDTDVTAMQLRLATHLLTHPFERARYVHAIDVGLREASNGGYDTHNYHVRDQSKAAVHMCRELVRNINEPGENDPTKLNLDEQMVLLTSEMGRTPTIQKFSDGGLNHWPYGFVVALIGGPIKHGQAGVVGAIGEDARATEYISPAELRAAILLAQGIYPFSREAFDPSDVRGDYDAVEATRFLMSHVLGQAV